jgi:hypothetical protein
MSANASYTGGCQCGAVRYAFDIEPHDPHICHCRMCQKAMGSFFAPLVCLPASELRWTKGRPARYRSSTLAERGFCQSCGTPLTFQYLNSDTIDVTIGSLDHPERVQPASQYGIEGRMPWFDALPGLPGTSTADDLPTDMQKALKSAQHPDHD